MFQNFPHPDRSNPSFGPNFAGHHYHQVNAASRVAGASPYQLVTILFEDVLAALQSADLAAAQGRTAMLNDQRYRALSILIALEASLDFRAGGDLAVSLARVYREASRLLRTLEMPAGNGAEHGAQNIAAGNIATDDANSAQANIRAAHGMIGELAEAWFAIGR
jgi:flagellar secretion chaperone FliS